MFVLYPTALPPRCNQARTNTCTCTGRRSVLGWSQANRSRRGPEGGAVVEEQAAGGHGGLGHQQEDKVAPQQWERGRGEESGCFLI